MRHTYVGNQAVRGVSGGQKRRVTIAEIITCPRLGLCADSISNGLDSATTFDIVKAMQLYCHNMNATCIISLLQVQCAELFCS